MSKQTPEERKLAVKRARNLKCVQKWRSAHPKKIYEYSRKWQVSHPEEKREYNLKYYADHAPERREYRLAHAEKYRALHLWKFYRITPEDYATIKGYQGKDPVFQLLLGKGKMKDAVEHRHADGLIRGLMAPMLNRAYGIIERLYPQNTSNILRALAAFHDSPPATEALGSPRYGIIGVAKSKKKPVYGSPNGPIKAPKKERKWASK